MTRTIFLMGMCLLAAAPFQSMAAGHPPTARDHYYEAALEDGGREPAWRGVRTSILLRRDRGNQEPSLREVSEQADFRNNDSFRLRVESNMDGYLYLFLRDTSGNLRLLFPYEGGKARTNKVSSFESRLVPGKAATWFRFDNKPGAEQVFLFLSAKPIPELEQMKKGANAEMLKNLERLVASNGTPESMRFDEGDLEDGGDQGATFYAEKNTPNRAFLVRRIELMPKAE